MGQGTELSRREFLRFSSALAGSPFFSKLGSLDKIVDSSSMLEGVSPQEAATLDIPVASELELNFEHEVDLLYREWHNQEIISNPIRTPPSNLGDYKFMQLERDGEIVVIRYPKLRLEQEMVIPPGARRIVIEASRYDPPKGGTNCWQFIDGYCESKMRSGKSWEPYLNLAVAMSRRFPFGTRLYVPDIPSGHPELFWEVWDRGGAVNGNKADFLSPSLKGTPYAYMDKFEAWVDFSRVS
jgi:hypothetical protein